VTCSFRIAGSRASPWTYGPGSLERPPCCWSRRSGCDGWVPDFSAGSPRASGRRARDKEDRDMTRVGQASATIRTAAFLLLSLLVAAPAWAQTSPAPVAAPSWAPTAQVPADATTAPPVKVRSVLILPFATPDASREEAWLGEATAQSITNAFHQVPGLIQVERGRLKALAQPEAWDESA